MTSLGGALLALGVAAGLLAALVELAPLAGARERGGRRLGAFLLRLHVAGAVGALGLMLLFFLVTDVRYDYVWDHTHLDYPLAYKVAGLWGGQEGTVLLWAGLVASLALATRGRGPTPPRLDRVASAYLALLASALMTLALAGDAFRRTAASSLAAAPDGAGLADVLVTPLMVIHPPIQFVAYALIAVPAAYALAHWALPPREGDEWMARATAWARPAWLFATVGLGLGALWAYYVLSFGGYWAWDPVETSNLLPWLALTGFLHAGRQRAQGGDLPVAAPLLAAVAYLLTIFATFATRSGLWVSVHAFTDPTNRFEPDAAARLMGILGMHLPTRAFLALLTASALLAVALLLVHHARRTLSGPARAYALGHAVVALALAGLAAADVRALYGLLFEAARATGLGTTTGATLLLGALLGAPPLVVYLARDAPATTLRLDLRRLLVGAVLLFALATVVAFLLNMQVVNGQDRSLFDARAPLVALPFVALLAVGLGLAPLGRARALALAGTGLAAGVAGFFLFPDARVVALATPPLVAAGAATVLHLVHVQGRDAPRPLRLAGALTLGASLLALVFWANPPSVLLGARLPDALAVPTGLAGYALATLGILGALSTFRARDARLAMVGAGAATLAAGYGIGALLGLAALALLARHRGAFPAPSRRWRPADALRGLARAEAPRVRLVGVHLIHFALVVGLLGYAASTYSQQGETFAAVPPGTAVDLDDATIRLGAGVATMGADGRVDSVRHPIVVQRDGRVLAEGALELRWEGTPHPTYKALLDVERGVARDVYLQPMSFHVAGHGWVSEGETQRLVSADVDAVTFRVTLLPLMAPVWACIWTMGLGMSLALVGARLSTSASKARPVAIDAGEAAAPPSSQDPVAKQG